MIIRRINIIICAVLCAALLFSCKKEGGDNEETADTEKSSQTATYNEESSGNSDSSAEKLAEALQDIVTGNNVIKLCFYKNMAYMLAADGYLKIIGYNMETGDMTEAVTEFEQIKRSDYGICIQKGKPVLSYRKSIVDDICDVIVYNAGLEPEHIYKSVGVTNCIYGGGLLHVVQDYESGMFGLYIRKDDGSDETLIDFNLQKTVDGRELIRIDSLYAGQDEKRLFITAQYSLGIGSPSGHVWGYIDMNDTGKSRLYDGYKGMLASESRIVFTDMDDGIGAYDSDSLEKEYYCFGTGEEYEVKCLTENLESPIELLSYEGNIILTSFHKAHRKNASADEKGHIVRIYDTNGRMIYEDTDKEENHTYMIMNGGICEKYNAIFGIKTEYDWDSDTPVLLSKEVKWWSY